MQRLNVAGASAGIVKNAIEETQGGGAVEVAHVDLGFFEPLDAVGQRYYLVSGKSSGFSPNSASTSTMGTPWPLRWANQAWP
jgi:hypothetical protein